MLVKKRINICIDRNWIEYKRFDNLKEAERNYCFDKEKFERELVSAFKKVLKNNALDTKQGLNISIYETIEGSLE